MRNSKAKKRRPRSFHLVVRGTPTKLEATFTNDRGKVLWVERALRDPGVSGSDDIGTLLERCRFLAHSSLVPYSPPVYPAKPKMRKCPVCHRNSVVWEWANCGWHGRCEACRYIGPQLYCPKCKKAFAARKRAAGAAK